jgi:hypothetical protein
VFSFAQKGDLKPDQLAGQKTSMKSMRLRKAHFYYVLVFIHLAVDPWEIDDNTAAIV